MSKLFSVLFLFIACLMACYNAYPQSDSLARIRQKAMETVSIFQDSLNQYPEDPSFSRLLSNTSKVIFQLRSEKNSGQIRGIGDYFSQSINLLNEAKTPVDQKLIAKNINEDLDLKLHTQNPNLSLQSQNTFEQYYQVTINASIKGKPPKGNERLFWATFRGADQESMIWANKSEGQSDGYFNPYSVTIKLPGYITFWIKDENNSILYKSATDHYIMYPSDVKIDVNFIDLK